jgi:hypothetical protein
MAWRADVLSRLMCDVLSPDGLPRFVWTDDQPDPTTYTLTLLRAVAERQRWRAQYDRAKTAAAGAVDNCSATAHDPPNVATAHGSASSDNPPKPGPQEPRCSVHGSCAT